VSSIAALLFKDQEFNLNLKRFARFSDID